VPPGRLLARIIAKKISRTVVPRAPSTNGANVLDFGPREISFASLESAVDLLENQTLDFLCSPNGRSRG